MIRADSVSASASFSIPIARLRAVSRESVFSAPGWTTTPSASIPSATRRAWTSEVRDFARISLSPEAGLIR